MGSGAVILAVIVVAPLIYLAAHKYQVEHGQQGLPYAQIVFEKIDASAGTSLAPKDQRHRKEGALSKGNFGTVFAAIVNRRAAAVKTLDNVASQSEEKIEAARIEMLEESRIMRSVSGHENIVEALGVTINLILPTAAMERVNGKSLDKLRNELQELRMDEKVRLAGEASAGLAHVHIRGFLHRDMAARNCMVEQTPIGLGRLKLIDFGMATRVGTDGKYKSKALTQMPVRWCALESLENKTWTIPSEVPKDVAEVMQKSWDADPNKRPTANQFRDVCFKK